MEVVGYKNNTNTSLEVTGVGGTLCSLLQFCAAELRIQLGLDNQRED